MPTNIADNYSLYEAFLQLKSTQEAKCFLKDLCTPNELRAFKERFLIAQMLFEGSLSYRQIHEQTNISTTTITRVARFLNQEEYQGYKTIINRLKTHDTK